MRHLLTALVFIFLFTGPIFAKNTYVKGYTKSNGTYVQGHQKSSPNQYRYDNYSSKGNTNPYTGQKGYQKNEFSTPPVYNKSHKKNNGYVNPYSNPYKKK